MSPRAQARIASSAFFASLPVMNTSGGCDGAARQKAREFPRARQKARPVFGPNRIFFPSWQAYGSRQTQAVGRAS